MLPKKLFRNIIGKFSENVNST
jgi:hypothetical protein